MGPTSEYRAAVAKVLAGRSVAGSATSRGLPRDAIRNVLKGHDPKLTRADAICRALGITFTIGRSASDREAARHPPALRHPASLAFGPVDDSHLEDLRDRLSEVWDSCNADERRHLAAGVAVILDLVGAVRTPAPSHLPNELE